MCSSDLRSSPGRPGATARRRSLRRLHSDRALVGHHEADQRRGHRDPHVRAVAIIATLLSTLDPRGDPSRAGEYTSARGSPPSPRGHRPGSRPSPSRKRSPTMPKRSASLPSGNGRWVETSVRRPNVRVHVSMSPCRARTSRMSCAPGDGNRNARRRVRTTRAKRQSTRRHPLSGVRAADHRVEVEPRGPE